MYYRNRNTGELVKECEASEHVLEKCGLVLKTKTDETDEALQAMVFWYFSDGNWQEVTDEDLEAIESGEFY